MNRQQKLSQNLSGKYKYLLTLLYASVGMDGSYGHNSHSSLVSSCTMYLSSNDPIRQTMHPVHGRNICLGGGTGIVPHHTLVIPEKVSSSRRNIDVR